MTVSKIGFFDREAYGKLEIAEERMDWYERITKMEKANRPLYKRDFTFRKSMHESSERFPKQGFLPARTRYDGIRDFSRCTGGDRNPRNNDLQAKDRRALECDNNRNTGTIRDFFKRGRLADDWFKKALAGKLESRQGQSTVEYALVSIAFLALILGLGMLSDLLRDGVVVSHALTAASHGTQNAIAGASDVFSY